MEPLTVPGKLDALSSIGKFVMSAAAAAGLDKSASYRLRLAVDEVATNIILHGYEESGLSGDIALAAVIDDGRLTVSVEDSAIPFDPREAKKPEDMDLPPEERQIGGLGVYLALEEVDGFDYERIGDRNRNTFVMNRPPRGPEGA